MAQLWITLRASCWETSSTLFIVNKMFRCVNFHQRKVLAVTVRKPVGKSAAVVVDGKGSQPDRQPSL